MLSTHYPYIYSQYVWAVYGP